MVIQSRTHSRSAYVLSLRDVITGRRTPSNDVRIPAHVAMAHEAVVPMAREDSVYGTLLQDLLMEGYDPRVFSDQFTPTDPEEAWHAAFGPVVIFRGWISSLLTDISGLFQRIERVELRAADEIGDAVRVIETPRLVPIRALAGFAVLVLLVTLPAQAVGLARSANKTKDAAEGTGATALADLRASAGAASVASSAESLQRASSRFREADALLTGSNAMALGIAAAMPSQYRSARAILELGDKSSEAARLLAVGFDKVFSDPNRRLDERLDVLAAYARGVLPLLSDATRAAGTVSPKTLPEDKRAEFQKLSDQLQQATLAVREFAALADFLTTVVGKNYARRYLVVFQNQTELRPTGGFMGSLADVTLDRGAISKLFVPPGGTYDLKGQLIVRETSPQPLQLINATWQFQDANWFPDFPTTASKLRWFWSKSGQPTVDGVIAINASVVERLLDLTGPIDMPAYGKTIDRSNFLLETQKAVEMEYDRAANTPKKFVGDLATAMIERMKLFGKNDWLAAAGTLSDALATKDIQIAFSNADEEALAEKLGWSGQMKSTTGDSLALIEANVAGQKTDGVIEEAVDHVAEVQPDGSVIDRVTVMRTHHGIKGELFRGVRNVSYVRLYVPQGSTLLEASGFEPPPASLFKKPDQENATDADVGRVEQSMTTAGKGMSISIEGDRTVFGGWAQLDPGKTQKLTYRYRLPWTVKDLQAKLEAGPDASGATNRAAYSLLLTSQSGKTDRRITSSLRLPSGWAISWMRGAQQTSDRNMLLRETWDRDHVVAALIESPKELTATP